MIVMMRKDRHFMLVAQREGRVPCVTITHSLMPFMPKWHVGQQRVPSTSGCPLP